MEESFKLECKNAVYVRGKNDDGVYASMIKHYQDGRKEKFTKLYKNFKRSFYVTKPSKRDHKQKRAFEKIENCNEYKCRQMDLIPTAAKALGQGFFRGRPKTLWRNPYIYDVDRSITSVFRSRIMKRYGEEFTPNKVAVVDIETNVLGGDEYPIIVGVTCLDRAYLGITKEFMDGIPGGEKEIREAIDFFVGNYVKERNIKIEIFIHESPGEISKRAIDFLYDVMPDIVTGWNLDFDIGKISEYIARDGYDLAEVFSDRSLDPQFKFFKHTPGTASKSKADTKGVMKDKFISFEERWGVVECPSPFAFCCSMQVYWQLRIAGGKEAGYGLDAVLNRVLKLSKLKIPGVKASDGLAWHVEAQKHFKAAYVAYNLFDDISVELLNETTKDLSYSLPIFGITTDYKFFSMQTKRTADDVAHEFLNDGLVICGTSDQMKTVYDEAMYSKKHWIITLDAHGMTRNGLDNIPQLPGHRTNLFTNNGDSDKVSCYPSAQEMANAAPTTIKMAMVKMKGLDEMTQRSLGIDILSGKTAAVEVVYKAIPTLAELDEAVDLFRESVTNY